VHLYRIKAIIILPALVLRASLARGTPSALDEASRVAPVSRLVTRTRASLTMAPVWSTTATTRAAVFGVCARAGEAIEIVNMGRRRSVNFVGMRPNTLATPPRLLPAVVS